MRRAKSRKDQRQDQRLKEDEVRKISSKEQPTNIKKDRKVSRELNAELKFSNLLDAREKRLAELKYLLEIEDNEAERAALKTEIKILIRNPPPVEFVVNDSDDEIVILSKPPSSVTCSETPLLGDALLSSPLQTELWGDDAPSEFGDTEDAVDPHNYHDEDEREEDELKDTDSDTERSLSTNASLPVEVPTRVSPRRQIKKPTLPIASSAIASSSSSSSSATASSSPPTPPDEDLFTEMTRTRGNSKKRKLNRKQ